MYFVPYYYDECVSQHVLFWGFFMCVSVFSDIDERRRAADLLFCYSGVLPV